MEEKWFKKFMCFLFSIVFISTTGLFAQEEQGKNVEELVDLSLESIMNMTVVSASRHEQKIIDSPRSISVITAEEIREKNYRTTPEALSELLGVHLQETNYGGGSVILRGLVGNQVLIMVDGVRMNNAIYRYGPNQYLNTIDINQIERIEVVKGAGSVLYGSDALGGLVNIITKSKVQKTDGTDGLVRAFGRYATADQGSTGRLELSKQIGNLSFYGGSSIKNFNDLKGGTNTGLQSFTGYSEWAADFKLNYTAGEQHSFNLGYQHVTQKDLPRSDVVLSNVDIKRVWNPEIRDMLYFDYNFYKVAPFIDNVSAKVSYLTQSEEVHRIQVAKPNTESQNLDEVKTLGFTLQLNSSIGESQLFTYGADLSFDKLTSTRSDLDLIKGTSVAKAGTYADGSKYSQVAFFVQDEIKLMERLNANLGLRYSSVQVDAVLKNDATGNVNVNTKPSALVGSAYLLYKLAEGINLCAGVAQGFRAPNIDDATVLGSFGAGFEVPNPNLDPEKSINYEFGVKVSREEYSSSLFVYYDNIKGLIARGPGLYNGLPFVDVNGNGVKDASEQLAYQRGNIGEAVIYGFEWEGKFHVSKDLQLQGEVSWLKGDDKVANAPLTRIPPLEGLVAVRWNVSPKLWVEYYNLFATKQDRLSASDKSDFRIPVGGTPGHFTFNIRGAYDLNSYGRVTMGLENITNQSYRNHASGFDSPGINLVLGYDIAI